MVTWFDVRTGAHIARASQPLVGVNSKRCLEDERLVRELAALTFREVLNQEGEVVWAPCTYYIVDARSKLATRGNQAMGKGTEQVRVCRWNRSVRGGGYFVSVQQCTPHQAHASMCSTKNFLLSSSSSSSCTIMRTPNPLIPWYRILYTPGEVLPGRPAHDRLALHEHRQHSQGPRVLRRALWPREAGRPGRLCLSHGMVGESGPNRMAAPSHACLEGVRC